MLPGFDTINSAFVKPVTRVRPIAISSNGLEALSLASKLSRVLLKTKNYANTQEKITCYPTTLLNRAVAQLSRDPPG